MGKRANRRRSALARVNRSLESGEPGVEGQTKVGPWLLNDGWLPQEWGYLNFWQMDLDPLQGGSSAIVEACVAAYAQTIAMCPGDHWRTLANGGRERVTTSALSRILRRPNEYQSRSDFVLKLAADLYRDGNTYALAERNARMEVSALHPFNPRESRPVTDGFGNVFYELAGNNVVERILAGQARPPGAITGSISGYGLGGTSRLLIPARDVLHVKLEAKPNEPLIGIPPSRHASHAIAAQRAVGSQLANLFGNMNRPSGVIETEQILTPEQTRQLREAMNAAWRGIDNLGAGPPVLTNGLKWHGISQSAKESDVVNALRLTQEEVFMVYGVPPAILGMTDKATFSSVEALMQFWLARGLGFALNHIEVAMDHFFGLASWPDEYVEFDTRALLRSAYKDRVEGLARGVQGGLYAPNEARRMEDLPDAVNGDKPRVQQQVVPLDWGGFDFQPAPVAAPPPPNLPGGGGDKPADNAPADKPADKPPAGKSLLDIFRNGMADYERTA